MINEKEKDEKIVKEELGYRTIKEGPWHAPNHVKSLKPLPQWTCLLIRGRFEHEKRNRKV